jgi:nitrite reductase/ring-hydroxylating ferredoxin subunit
MAAALEGYAFACTVGDVPPRGKKMVHVGETRALIVACETGIYAIEDRCPQTGRPIAHGEVINCVITSPITGAEYDLRTGQYIGGGLSPLQSERLRTFPLKVDGNKVYILIT